MDVNLKEEVIQIIKEHKDRPNKDLVTAMDLLNQEYEFTKNQIIKLTKHLDSIEYTYNTILKEYDARRG
jgi:lysophospholipase L1-like esterase